jgi:antitoxin ParD1/3/4
MAGIADLGPQLEGYVADLVKSGRYQSRSDVLREGVRLVEERKGAWLRSIRRSTGVSPMSRAGRVRPIEETAARLTAKYKRMADDRGA